jgi:uncharacterized membrane protein YccC
MKTCIHIISIAALLVASSGAHMQAETSNKDTVKAYITGLGALAGIGAIGYAIHTYGTKVTVAALTAVTTAAGAWYLLNKAASVGGISNVAQAMEVNLLPSNPYLAMTPAAIAGAAGLGLATYYAMYYYLSYSDRGAGTQTTITHRVV